MEHTQKEFFNTLARKWPNIQEYDDVIETIVNRSKLSNNKTILDLGCGKGVMVEYLQQLTPSCLYEVDCSKEMMKDNMDLHNDMENILFVCGDFYKLLVQPVDYIIVFNAYPHFMDKVAFKKQLLANLKVNGEVIIAHNNSKEFINSIHGEDRTKKAFSVPLKTPMEEYEVFKDRFALVDYYDQEYYFMRLRKR